MSHLPVMRVSKMLNKLSFSIKICLVVYGCVTNVPYRYDYISKTCEFALLIDLLFSRNPFPMYGYMER